MLVNTLLGNCSGKRSRHIPLVQGHLCGGLPIPLNWHVLPLFRHCD